MVIEGQPSDVARRRPGRAGDRDLGGVVVSALG